MKDKKSTMNKIFWKLFLILLVGYTAIYISEASGYYEFENHNKKVLTEEKIKEFEQDIKDGKNIDLDKYVDQEDTNYENNISKIGNKLSEKSEEIVVKGLNTTFKFLNKIFES
jgi:hypothetical protein